MNHHFAKLLAGLAAFATLTVPAFAQQPTTKSELQKLQKQLELSKLTLKSAQLVTAIAQLKQPSSSLATISKTLDELSGHAGSAAKVLKKLDKMDDDERRRAIDEQMRKQPDWIDLALKPAKTLKTIESTVRSTRIPVYDAASAPKLSLEDLTKRTKAAVSAARAQYRANAAVVAELETQVTRLSDMQERAQAARQAMHALAKSWQQAYSYGCGVLGSYCGIQYLEAEELARLAGKIAATAKTKHAAAKEVLAAERVRLDNYASNMKTWFGIEVR